MSRPPAHLPPGVDPRSPPADGPPPPDGLRPRVASASAGTGLIGITGGALALGVLAFLWLSGHRTQAPQVPPPSEVADAATVAAPPVPPDVDAEARAARALPARPREPALALVTPPPPLISQLPPQPPPAAPAPAVRAPTLVVDLPPASAQETPPAPASGAPGRSGPEAGRPASGGLNADEQFAARVESGPEPEHARASMLRNQSTVAPEGTIIPAVLETALNSDLPGYARAVVSRDVRSFNGANILIPRGSRVVGEYRSAVSLGQSRIFVIWTRILRPDGASIQISSGGGDDLGRAGLEGKVDTHFFQRFSGAVLLTVLNAAAYAAAGTPSTQVVIGSSTSGGVGGAGALAAPAEIPPTIKVAQGAPIRIFVQRDLDFTSVGGSGR